ncbi:MAG: ABC1 family protein [Candidatus Xenolissoclinum pacificiensis L6]|uniref:ABC1 family protein n=1 Tax=Candidatus Xenolissoclinum pacificiensis L6 TaxID=1401685 RepID=W2V1M2_9RICK|nr:MAG: ABC1 family protein [Candidatus Xenolissoclinum pacificiensis L6]
MIIKIIPRILKILLFTVQSYIIISYTKNYNKLVKNLESMGPTFIKIGQLLSTRSDILSDEFVCALLNLCDQVKPECFNKSKKTIEKDLKSSINKLFKDINPTPYASASVSQVFQGTLHSGQKVAVKVIRHNIKNIILLDILILKIIVKIISTFTKKVVILNHIIKRISSSVTVELNMRLEGSQTSEMYDNFKNKPNVIIPSIIWKYTTRNILTQSWIEGIPLSQVRYLSENTLILIFKTFIYQSYSIGFFHGDMHSGNIIIVEDNKIALIDFGIMGRINKQEKKYISCMTKALMDKNYQMIADIQIKYGYIQNTQHDILTQCRAIAEPIINQPVQEISIATLITQIFNFINNFDTNINPSLLLLQKNIMMLEGIAIKFHPSINLWYKLGPILRKMIHTNLNTKESIKEILSAPVTVINSLQQQLSTRNYTKKNHTNMILIFFNIIFILYILYKS